MSVTQSGCEAEKKGMVRFTVSANYVDYVKGTINLSGPDSYSFDFNKPPGGYNIGNVKVGTYSVSITSIKCKCQNQVGEVPSVNPIWTESITIKEGGYAIILLQESCGCYH